jgi:hypothetical protein
MEVSGQVHAPAALPEGWSPWYPLDRLGGPQSRYESGDEKNSQPIPGLEPPIIQPVAQRYTTELKQESPVLFLTEHNAMKACWWSGGIAPLIL